MVAGVFLETRGFSALAIDALEFCTSAGFDTNMRIELGKVRRANLLV